MKIGNGDRTERQTGHILDLHFGDATMPYNSKLVGWAIPGVFGKIPGLEGSVVGRERAEVLIRKLDSMIRRGKQRKEKNHDLHVSTS